MSRIKIIQMLLLAAIVGGCAKSETTVDVGGGDDTAAPISLGTTLEWSTKGASIDDLTDIKELTLYSFDAYAAGSWAEITNADDLAPFFTTTTTPLTLTTSDYGATWDYTSTTGGLRYWRGDDAEAVTFFALYPESELTTTFDETTGKPIFNYNMSASAVNNDDLVVDAIYDLNNSNTTDGKVEFVLQHALTKLTLEVQTDNSVADDYAYSNDEFRLYGVTFHGLYNDADLEIDGDGTVTWTHDETSTIDMTATQGLTFLSTTDETTATGMNAASLLSSDPLDVMIDDKTAIYALPQLLDEERGDDAPTVSIRILRTFYANEEDETANKLTSIVYETQEITVPAAEGYEETGWSAGQHNRLTFAFDLANLAANNTPMTLFSEIYDWTYTDVDVEVHPNIYIYASANEFTLASDETTADMYIYTNYDYDLRIPRSKSELDGSITTANGFTFYPSGSTTSFAPTILDASGNAITFDMDSDDDVTANGSKLPIYDNDSGEEFYDMSAYYTTDDVPGDEILHLNWNGSAYEAINWIKCEISLGGGYTFNYYVGLSTREQLELYTNTGVESESAGINKDGSDAVYILRLVVQESHLDSEGSFSGAIGAEILSNGGGMITNKFSVVLNKEL